MLNIGGSSIGGSSIGGSSIVSVSILEGQFIRIHIFPQKNIWRPPPQSTLFPLVFVKCVCISNLVCLITFICVKEMHGIIRNTLSSQGEAAGVRCLLYILVLTLAL